jgi:hypothetical protein
MEKNDNWKEFNVKCECGCGELKFSRYEWNDKTVDYGISYWMPVFYGKQIRIFDTIVERVKNAWTMLRGRQFLLYDVCLSPSDWEKFKEEVNRLDKEE